MAGSASGLSWDRLARIRLPRQWRGFLTWSVLGLGAVLAVVPGFVAACHIMRLVVLSVLLPAMLSRVAKQEQRAAE